MPYRDPNVARIKSLAYYYRVRQKREGRIPGNQGGRQGRSVPGVRTVAGRPLWLSSDDERQDCKNIKEFICQRCGNNRLFIPDSGRKCRVCVKRRRLERKQRMQKSGTWGVATRLAKHRRRALRKANGGAGIVTAQDWRDILAKYGTACLCCGHHCDGKPTMDHVVPLSQGGPHDKSNLQPLCHLCNSLKSDTIADYRPDRPLAPMARDPVKVRYVPGTD